MALNIQSTKTEAFRIELTPAEAKQYKNLQARADNDEDVSEWDLIEWLARREHKTVPGHAEAVLDKLTLIVSEISYSRR